MAHLWEELNFLFAKFDESIILIGFITTGYGGKGEGGKLPKPHIGLPCRLSSVLPIKSVGVIDSTIILTINPSLVGGIFSPIVAIGIFSRM